VPPIGADHADLPVHAGTSLRLALPAGVEREPDAALPAVSLGGLPGVSVALRAGFRGPDATLRVLCASAPSRGYAPGVEGFLLARASQIARAAIPAETTRFDAAEAREVGPRVEQRFSAGARDLAAEGRHLFGFAGPGRDAVLCTVLCTEREGGARCAPLVEAARAEGAWLAAPPPSLWVRAILAGAEHPQAATLMVGAATIAAAALVIARRPRPRRR
jgi:hypothetical protein